MPLTDSLDDEATELAPVAGCGLESLEAFVVFVFVSLAIRGGVQRFVKVQAMANRAELHFFTVESRK